MSFDSFSSSTHCTLDSLFLSTTESNTLLKPAIHTYKKLGFRELAEYHPAYARGDIQMELTLE